MYRIGFGLTLQIAVWCVIHAAVTKNMTVLVGEDVTMECNQDSVSPKSFYFWYRDSKVLAVKDVLTDDTPLRFSLNHGDTVYNLDIAGIQAADEGVYLCEVSTSDSSNKEYRLTVNIPPNANIQPDQPEIDVGLGEDLNLQCTGTGKPQPTITWVRKNGVFSDGEINKHTELLQFKSMKKTDSGSYSCIADTGFGHPARRDVKINVRYEPTVEVKETFIHSGLGDVVSIQCTFMASPSAETEWSFNNSLITTDHNEAWITTTSLPDEENNVVSVLKIASVTQKHFGTYTCTGSNTWGQIDADIIVSGIPIILDITSGKENKYVNQYTLQWRVQSKAKMVKYHLMLKEINESIQNPEWREMSLKPSKSQDGEILTTQAYHISNLNKNSTYTVKLRAENVVGLGEWSEEYPFKTPEDGETAPTDTDGYVYDIDNGSVKHSFSCAVTLIISFWILFIL